MKRQIIFLVLMLFALSAAGFAQEIDPTARAARWKEFKKYNFEEFDFSKQKLTRAKVANLKEDENADDFALLRGVVFGKRGRVFKERSIQEYLDKQPWYKANPKFSNSVLTLMERTNLDFVRLIEAEKHPSIE